MVGWEQISHLFVDSDHNNLQFWILKPPVNLPARYSWCGMGAQIRHSSCLWLFAQSIEIQKSIWKSHWNHYMILDAKNIQELSHLPPFSIFGPRLVPQMTIFPMAFGAFPQRWMTRFHRWRGENRAATGAACAWPGHRGDRGIISECAIILIHIFHRRYRRWGEAVRPHEVRQMVIWPTVKWSLASALNVGNGWVAGGCWDYYW